MKDLDDHRIVIGETTFVKTEIEFTSLDVFFCPFQTECGFLLLGGESELTL